MPCNCDHLEPSLHEQESKKLMILLAGIGLFKNDVPYYGEVAAVHEHTALLCKFCENNDVSNYSLELQIWWRDHLEADKIKAQYELNKEKADKEKKLALEKTNKEKKLALEKLTPNERKLLGL
jgi:hypothetical protein